MLTQERLKELFKYEPDTGNFIRLIQTERSDIVGSIAGVLNGNGYLQIYILDKYYQAHRLAVLYVTGKWPENEVDHIDGIRNNNKWKNLREATRSQNQENQKKAQKDNKSCYLGVSPSSNKNGSFVATIMVKGKQCHLGMFKDPKLAHEAYITAKRKLHEFNTI